MDTAAEVWWFAGGATTPERFLQKFYTAVFT
jgi:hypothetical protein